jgi:transcriptional regulator with XRE-family HTH domain
MNWFFGEYLQRLLEEREWTASRLAKKANLSHVYMGQLLKGSRGEEGKPSRISVDTVTSIAQALGIQEYKLLLAYKGIDPDKSLPHIQESFNIYSEIHSAAQIQDVDLNQLSPEVRHHLEASVVRTSKKLVRVLVEEALQTLHSKAVKE